MSLSLKPDAPRGAARLKLPGGPVLRTLVLAGALLAIAGGAWAWAARREAGAAGKAQQAAASVAAADLAVAKVKKQLGIVSGAGGAQRVQLIRELAASRMNWRLVLVKVSKAVPPSVQITSFTATASSGAAPAAPASGTPAPAPAAPAASGAAPASGSGIQMAGTAPTRAALALLISNLRTAGPPINTVTLQSVTSGSAGPAAGPSGPAAPSTGGGQKFSFNLSVELASPPPPPGGAS